VVLLPKGGGDYRGIGLLEIVWKVIESIINRRIASKIQFHDSLHGFIAKFVVVVVVVVVVVSYIIWLAGKKSARTRR
jgi:phage-related holin